jgi:hypothetical protein
MNKLFNLIKSQLFNNMVLNKETILKLNAFFKDVNQALKGSSDTLIFIYVDQYGTLNTNLLNDDLTRVTPIKFKRLFIEYLEQFQDDQELLFDVVMLLDNNNLIKLTSPIKLYLFKVLYNSGYFCYVAVDSTSFKDNYDFIVDDLRVISNLVNNNNTLKGLDDDLNIILKELYLFDDVTLKDILI